jgi:CRISPR/Cas system-associated exonuclease Cas4 (RecB family)
MSYYNSQRTRNLFIKNATAPYKLSRSKIQDFLNCPRCFYLDRRCGTSQPGSLPFTLNNAVDSLLKKEFDVYRINKEPHPIMVQNGVSAVPFMHESLDAWRQNFKGIQYLHEGTNFLITGAVDDIWVAPSGELIVVDYKATSTTKEITLEEKYRQSYKNQMEVYQWLFRKNGFKVSNTGYFLYCNGDVAQEGFDQRLYFDVILLPYVGDDRWIEKVLLKIKACLEQDVLPPASKACEFCSYWEAVKGHVLTLTT